MRLVGSDVEVVQPQRVVDRVPVGEPRRQKRQPRQHRGARQQRQSRRPGDRDAAHDAVSVADDAPAWLARQ